jgi:hypothetical protein
MVASSTESMKKFAKDMSKQQQLYAMPPLLLAALALSLLFGYRLLSPARCLDAEQQNQMLRKKSSLAEQCVTMLQEEKQLAAAAAEKKSAVLQALCRKLQQEKKALMQQLSQ